MIFFVGRAIIEPSDYSFVEAKTVSRQNMHCVIFRSLSEFPIMN